MNKLCHYLIILCVLTLIIATLPALAIAIVNEAVIYEGSAGHDDGEAYNAQLYLAQNHTFILHEKIVLPNGKVSSWNINGKWHQIRKGTCLQLTNISGLHRILSIGSDKSLYIDAQLPTKKWQTLVLKKSTTSSIECTFTGWIYKQNSSIIFQDYESEYEFVVNTDKQMLSFFNQKITDGKKKFVKISAKMYCNDSENVLSVFSIDEIEDKKYMQGYLGLNNFIEFVTEKNWIYLSGAIEFSLPILIRFSSEIENRKGVIDVFDGVSYSSGNYTITEENISISALLPISQFMAMLQTAETWKISGEVLELYSGKNLLALFEEKK